MPSITAVSANAASAASPTFSVTSPVRLISPRTSRPNAFSSRSSASMPAASSSATNIIERDHRDLAPRTRSATSWSRRRRSRLTCTGLLIEARIGLERSRLSAASPAKRETCSSAIRSGASFGSPAIAASMIARARRRPRMSTAPTIGSATLPPATITFRYLADSLQHLGGDRGVGLGQRRVDRVLDVLRLERVLGAVVDLDRRPPAAAEPERALQLLGHVGRHHERAERLAGLDLRDRLLARLDADRVDLRRTACRAYWVASTRRPPSATSDLSSGTRLANATRGLLGPDESAAPATSETTTE